MKFAVRSAVAGLFFVSMFVVVSAGADKAASKKGNKPFAVGEQVELEFLGKTVVGEVTGYEFNGWIHVKVPTPVAGVEQTILFPPGKIRALKGAANKKGAVAKGEKAAAKALGDLQEWTDKTGKFKVKARFVKLDGDDLSLQNADGKSVTLAISKLSETSQKLAKKLAEEFAENPFESSDDNPFGTDLNDGPETTADGGDDAAADADWSQVRPLLAGPAGGGIAPDPAPALTKPVSMKSVSLASGRAGRAVTDGFFENIEGLLFNRHLGGAMAVIIDSDPRGGPKIALQGVNLVDGKASPPVLLNAKMKPVDVDPEGTQIAAVGDFHLSHGNLDPSVGVWKLNNGKLEVVRKWRAVEPGNIHDQAPSSADFIDSDHLLTVAFPSKLAMWQISRSRAIYKAEISGQGKPALSPGHKYLAVAINNSVAIFDALTGDGLVTLPGDRLDFVKALTFSPDGQRLAALGNQRLMVWGLQKGELERNIFFPSAIAADTAHWVADGYILCGEQLIDLERRIALWTYRQQGKHGFGSSAGELGGIYWYASQGNDRSTRGVFPVKLPHDAALKAAAALDPDSLLAVRPGLEVNLMVRVAGTQQEQETVYRALADQLTKQGMKVTNQGTKLILYAGTETGKTNQVSYRSFGFRGSGNQTAQVTEQICRIRYVENDKVVWEQVVVGGEPGVLQLKEGQTVQQALAPYQRPDLGFFSRVRLPDYIARPHPSGAYGVSELTVQGVRESR